MYMVIVSNNFFAKILSSDWLSKTIFIVNSVQKRVNSMQKLVNSMQKLVNSVQINSVAMGTNGVIFLVSFHELEKSRLRQTGSDSQI